MNFLCCIISNSTHLKIIMSTNDYSVCAMCLIIILLFKGTKKMFSIPIIFISHVEYIMVSIGLYRLVCETNHELQYCFYRKMCCKFQPADLFTTFWKINHSQILGCLKMKWILSITSDMQITSPLWQKMMKN